MMFELKPNYQMEHANQINVLIARGGNLVVLKTCNSVDPNTEYQLLLNVANDSRSISDDFPFNTEAINIYRVNSADASRWLLSLSKSYMYRQLQHNRYGNNDHLFIMAVGEYIKLETYID